MINIKILVIWVLSSLLIMTNMFCIYINIELQYFKSISENAIIEKYIYTEKIKVLDDLIKEAEFQKKYFFDSLLRYNEKRQYELDSLLLHNEEKQYKLDSITDMYVMNSY
jgi:hypothetical protein